MNWFKVSGIMVLIFMAANISSWLPAAETTATQPAESSDLNQANQALQEILEQGPPITAPTLPSGTPKRTSGKVQPLPQVVSPSLAGVPKMNASTGQKLFPEGHYIADRRGRLVKGKNYWTFTFESDGKAMADPPIKILPNRWLEKMESDVTASHETIIFQVSGEITVYHGENFLLLRKVLIERESSGNFK